MKFVPLTAALLLALTLPTQADLLVRTDNVVIEGKALPGPETADLSFQPADPANAPAQTIPRAQVAHIILTDDHGARLGNDLAAPKWNVPPPPAAPPILAAPTKPSYYLIPLHGEVGKTILASVLEQSLADAVKRHPTVVVLDIDSPGGLVAEAEQIIKVLHTYNSKLRIVALTDQDLSAAAVLSLSVKEIYVKSTSTIGAATSFKMSPTEMPQDIAEKMQSAWRAVARNSAEEGGHNPLLADAMIDSSLDLHLETTSAGAPVVKEGAGDKMVVHKGKILTLTSHEAIDCGLAAGMADDIADLGTKLKLPGWTPIAGLGTLLADDLPKRNTLYEDQLKTLTTTVQEHLDQAKSHDPAVGTVTRTIFAQPAMPIRPTLPQPPTGPRRIGPGGRMTGPMPPARVNPGPMGPAREVVTTDIQYQWKNRSLACTVALQDVERDCRQAISLADAFGKQGDAAAMHEALDAISEARARIFDERNKYPPHAVTVAERTPGAPPATRPAAASAPAKLAATPPARPGAPMRVATLDQAEAALASGDARSITNGARFLTSAAVDPSTQPEVIKALTPLLADPPSQKNVCVAAYVHWAGKADMPPLVAALERKPDPPNDVGEAQCWVTAFATLVHLAPDDAEKAINENKKNIFFRSGVTRVLEKIILDDTPDTATARRLRTLLTT